MDVSENSGTPKSSIFNRVFHYKPSIVGYPYFRKHPYDFKGKFAANLVGGFSDIRGCVFVGVILLPILTTMKTHHLGEYV